MRKGSKRNGMMRESCIFWETGFLILKTSARFSSRLRWQIADGFHQRYNHPDDRNGEHHSLPRGSAKSEDAKN